MFLARKITRAKWRAQQGLAAEEISADAVTIDLRTQENVLSFWQCPTDAVDGVEEAALAIAAAGERVDKLDIVWLDDQELQDDGQTLRNSEGRTPVTRLADLHVEVSRLDYVRLGSVARRIVAAIEANKYRRLTRRRVKELIAEAVEQGHIDIDRLEDKVRAEVAT